MTATFFVAGLTTLFVLLLSLCYFGFISLPRRSRDEKGEKPRHVEHHGIPRVVIGGPSSSGKTSLLHSLVFGRAPRTVSSVRVTSLTLPLHNIDGGVISWQEFPSSSRGALLDAAAQSRVIMILVNAIKGPAHLAEAGSMIFDCYTQARVVNGGARLLVVATGLEKSDTSSLRVALGAELDRLRSSHGIISTVASDSDDKIMPLRGADSRPFNFSSDAPLRTDFISVVAANVVVVRDFVKSACS